jgi:hypothetical protein
MEMPEIHNTKLSILDKRIKSFAQGYRQNIAILGNDRNEISYLLENYFTQNKLKEIIYIHVTASYCDRKNFFKNVAVCILNEYLDKCDSLDNLINYGAYGLGVTINFIKDVIKHTHPPAFIDVLELINKFINESDKKCILVIENLISLKKIFPNFHNDFSKFIILQQQCMVILASLHTRESEKTLYCDLNFLFGNFEKIIFSENNFFENYTYLKKILNPLPCSPFFISFFVNIFGHNSTYYELLSPSMKEISVEADEEESIIAILRKLLCEQQSYLFQKFISYIDAIENNFKDSPLIIKLLLALSDGYIRKKELASLHLFDPKELPSKLNKLCELNYIDNLGNIYKVKDPLFAFWLSCIFKPSFYPQLLDKNKRNQVIGQAISRAISFFREEFYKDKIKKVLELITSFKNDALRMGKIRYRLPFITKTRLMSYPEKNLHFLIGEGHEIIFVGIKEAYVEDSDIFEFIEKGSVIKGKSVRKIFISLDTFSPSAKLAAKNNKLTVWDINDINDLMYIYQKPILVQEKKPESRIPSESFSNL